MLLNYGDVYDIYNLQSKIPADGNKHNIGRRWADGNHSVFPPIRKIRGSPVGWFGFVVAELPGGSVDDDAVGGSDIPVDTGQYPW